MIYRMLAARQWPIGKLIGAAGYPSAGREEEACQITGFMKIATASIGFLEGGFYMDRAIGSEMRQVQASWVTSDHPGTSAVV